MIELASIDDKPIIEDLMQDYLGGLSAFTDDLLSVNGRYQYPYLDHYWSDPARHPFLIKSGKTVVGFVLSREEINPAGGSVVMEIAELYVVPEYRQQGLGRRTAIEIWQQSPGTWRVCVLKDNKVAYKFWRKLILDVDPCFSEESPSKKTNNQTVFHLISN
ncbi:MAG: GNAT family N-acetyltransferase [Gammaproteobacteria bacterium]|jgi:predicted acetyltransferase|nr:GNAT family N-acetyltransferase [Gammaproteobacteria bacterium]MBT4492948.1 GNAT family N-acetyltransferase [Gammaproteobacteria bacterium]MBT7372076.1 GNAT family N-acetyltransferase [Gammaproteobacteria bacterium]